MLSAYELNKTKNRFIKKIYVFEFLLWIGQLMAPLVAIKSSALIILRWSRLVLWKENHVNWAVVCAAVVCALIILHLPFFQGALRKTLIRIIYLSIFFYISIYVFNLSIYLLIYLSIYWNPKDILPYSTAETNPLQHELFDKFLQYSEGQGRF